jgi:hypothetical protein
VQAQATLSGTVIGRRFVLESIAGRGGMGAVWLAKDLEAGSKVAVKLMRSDDHTERFVREAQLLAELAHPRVVRYIDHGLTDEREPYLAMEWLDGIDLAQKLAGQPLAIADAIRVALHAAEGLAFAHAHGVIHRDIKPSNLFLPRGNLDDLKVLDFGIARLQLASQAMTRTGATLGTPGYMAPEQARGDRDVDARADLFALGCVLFEALTGRPPFAGEHLMAVLAKVLFEDAPRVRELRPDVPAALDQLVARLLSKRAAERPANAAAVIAELTAIGGGAGEAVPRPTMTALTTDEQRLFSVVLAGNEPGHGEPTIDPHDVTAATGQIATQFDAGMALAAFGATVERLADGTIVAIVSGRGAATDQAAQAARCALALRRLRPNVAMALATGRGAVAGRLPVGDVIDRAVRLLSRTLGDAADERAAIRLDETTAGLLDLRFEVGGDTRGLVLHGEREVLEATRTLLGKPTPCVGRERELALLDGIFAECVADPVAHAVLVTAPAGTGKSRLLGEFLRRRKDAGDDIELWIGRGDPLAAGSAFAIVAQALRRACGMLDGEPLAVRQHKLRARVARHVPAAERKRVTEFLGELVGCEITDGVSEMLRSARGSAVLMNDQIRRAFEDFVVAEATAHPLVLVLEDLQWGDVPTTKLVGGALRRAASLPLMVIGVARPEIHELFPNLWAGKVTHVPLGDLTARAGERLIRAVLGSVAPDLVARMLERAGGNAFYLEELIRAVAEGKGDALPDTVLAMLQARLDALDAHARRTLRAASVFGQGFWADGVATLVGGAPALDALVERELIERVGDGRFPQQDEYMFRHAIVRDAAYSLLTEDDRVLGHRLAGRWLEDHGETDARVLAEHYESGGDHERAVTWYVHAAAQALEAHDFEGTIARAERGIACGATGELRGQLRAHAAEAEQWRGDLARAVAPGEEALALLPAGSPSWYDAIGVMARVYAAVGRKDALIELSRALAAQRLENRDERCVLAWVKVVVRLLFLCEYALADELLAPLAAVLIDHETGPNVCGAVHEVFAHRRLIEGDLDQALRLTIASVGGYREAGNLRDAHYEQIGVALVQMELGAWAAAEATLRELVDVAAQLGIQTIGSVSKLNLALALGYIGRPEAEAIEREALAELLAAQDQRLAMNARCYLTRILALAGKYEDAVREGAAALALRDANTDPVNSILVLAAYARALLGAGRAGEALTFAEQAAHIFDELGHIEEGEALIRVTYVEALLATGDIERGRAVLAAAFRRTRERAERVRDPAWRTSFLEQVPENARIVALAHEHGLA